MAAAQAGSRLPPPLLVLLPLLLLAGAVSGTTRAQYCQLCSSHTMCLYSNVSSACLEGQLVRGVSPDEQNTIVLVHNMLRDRVAQGRESRGAPGPQPSASNMLPLVWDDEVAAVAQRWADQCDYRHDSCRNVPDSYVGQNLYLRSHWPCSSADTAANWTEATLAWYDEVTAVGPSDVRRFSGSEAIGHYTQLVWATTARVGCGYTRYQNNDWCRKYYVCNYAPGGNYVGQPLYGFGSPHTQCPADASGPNPSFRGLCGASASASTAAARATVPDSAADSAAALAPALAPAGAPGSAPGSAPAPAAGSGFGFGSAPGSGSASAPAARRGSAPAAAAGPGFGFGSAPGSAAGPGSNPARTSGPSSGTVSNVPATDPSAFSSPFGRGFNNDPNGFGTDTGGFQRRRRSPP